MKIKRILAQAAQKRNKMKRLRLTRISIKTREVIYLSQKTVNDTLVSVCPVCHSALSASLPAAESPAAVLNNETQTTRLSPADDSGKQH